MCFIFKHLTFNLQLVFAGLVVSKKNLLVRHGTVLRNVFIHTEKKKIIKKHITSVRKLVESELKL